MLEQLILGILVAFIVGMCLIDTHISLHGNN